MSEGIADTSEQGPDYVPVHEGLHFTSNLSYETFDEAEVDEGCNSGPEDDTDMGAVFEHYLYKHCLALKYITLYRGILEELNKLMNESRELLDGPCGRFARHQELAAVNYGFVAQVGSLLSFVNGPGSVEAKAASRPERVWSASNQAVLSKLQELRAVLRELSERTDEQEREIIVQLLEHVDTAEMQKESELYIVTGTKGAQGWRREKVGVADESGMAGTRAIGQASITGVFHSIQHGKVAMKSGKESRPATMLVVDLSIMSPKRSSIDYAIFEMTYRDEPWKSNNRLRATEWFEPQVLCGLSNGCLINNSWMLEPEITVGGIGVKVGSIQRITERNEDDNCWKIQGTWVTVNNLPRKHKWVLDGDDTRKFTVPQQLRLVTIVEHGMKPFTVDIVIRGRLRGFWANAHRYLARWIPYQSDRYLVKPEASEKVLTEKAAEEIALEKNKQYLLAQPVQKLLKAREEADEKRKVLDEYRKRMEEMIREIKLESNSGV